MTWKIRTVSTVRFLPAEDEDGGQRFLPLKVPLVKVVIEHIVTKACITITKGTSYTVKNPPVKKPQYIDAGKRGKIINKWAPSVEMPGPVTVLDNTPAFVEYATKRFGETLARDIVDRIVSDFSGVR